METLLNIGDLCRSKDAIIRCVNDEDGRVCRVINLVPAQRWKRPDVPEYKVQLVAMPVVAFRRATDLELLS